jgi:hypothetical protein
MAAIIIVAPIFYRRLSSAALDRCQRSICEIQILSNRSSQTSITTVAMHHDADRS